jgi:hypothetical protein
VRRWQQGRRDHAFDPLVRGPHRRAGDGGGVRRGRPGRWYAARGRTILPDVGRRPPDPPALASLAFLSACAVSVAGMVVQRWCRLPTTTGTQEGDRDDAA